MAHTPNPSTAIQPSAADGLRQAVRWRVRRARQYLRVRYLSWRHPEVTVAGVRIPLFPYISDNVREAMFDGGYETAELRTIADHLQPDDVVFEIGTGIGLISAHCAQRIGSDRVFTFEANPELERLIRALYERNGVAPQLQICVLGRDDGSETFYVHDDFWSSSTVRRQRTARAVTVPRRSLNAALARIRPTFLIVDIEGGEGELFDFIVLDSVRKISIELHDSIIGRARVDDIVAGLEREGFRVDWQHSSVIDGFKRELFLARAV